MSFPAAVTFITTVWVLSSVVLNVPAVKFDPDKVLAVVVPLDVLAFVKSVILPAYTVLFVTPIGFVALLIFAVTLPLFALLFISPSQ